MKELTGTKSAGELQPAEVTPTRVSWNHSSSGEHLVRINAVTQLKPRNITIPPFSKLENMSGRNNPSQTSLDQPLNLLFLSSVPHLTQTLSQSPPLPKSYHFILLLDKSVPSSRDVLSQYRRLMLRQSLPCYHLFYYFDDISELQRYVEKEYNSLPKEEKVLRQFVDVSGGHALVVREETANQTATRDRMIEVQSKEGLERAMERLKFVRFAEDDGKSGGNG
mmetsp:Transcript_3720/g.14140  ORF Transcript_3720/g.14140 Transcript_3720/m.14140 type:complete len:222 (-) Transcript_3720:1373-2038(-)